jgi:hypothetical protein
LRIPNENWAASGIVFGYTWISSRIIQLKMRISSQEFNMVGMYAPVECKQEE